MSINENFHPDMPKSIFKELRWGFWIVILMCPNEFLRETKRLGLLTTITKSMINKKKLGVDYAQGYYFGRPEPK